MSASLTFAHPESPGLVSIIIPTHRGERFLAETLATIAAQTHADWELIVVEDGSRDGSESIVRDFAERHPKRRVVFTRNERNYGPSHSRNVAFALARGEFVALLDSDDRWLPDHLAQSLATLATTGGDVAYSTVVMFEDKTEILLGVWGPQAHELESFPTSLIARSFITPSATVMRRRVLAAVGPWDVSLRCCEDFQFWLRAAALGMQFCYVGGCHCLYRKNHQEAATGKTAWILETLADVGRQYMTIPGLRPKLAQKFVSKNYALAAAVHAAANASDPSADPTRAPRLYWQAWQLRRQRVGHLYAAAKLLLKLSFKRRRPRPAEAPATPAIEPVRRRAA